MKLKRIVEQTTVAAQYYDLGKDFTSFTRAMDMATEEVKNRFEQAIAAKLKGKKIRARASRGYKQFEKDYEINVTNVSLDDYYDNYVVVVRGSDNKEYFLKPGFKVQILGAADQEQPEEPIQPQKQPEKPETPTQPPQQPPQAQPAVPQSAVPQSPQSPEQSIKEMDTISNTEIVRKYPIDAIVKDLENWLPRLMRQSGKDLRPYVPQEGVSRTKGRKTIISYGITIPVQDLPGLTVDQIKQELSQATKLGDIEQIYTLEKFDVRNDKYVIIVKKITNY